MDWLAGGPEGRSSWLSGRRADASLRQAGRSCSEARLQTVRTVVSEMISTLICEGNLGLTADLAGPCREGSMRLVDDADEVADLQALEQETRILLADADAAM
jgi:hypothetical protein